MNRTKIAFALAGCFALCTLVLAGFLLAPKLRASPKPDPRMLLRQGGKSVIQIPERVPSAGRAWSLKQYPQEYSEPNLAVSNFTGLELSRREAERYLDIGARAFSREVVAGVNYTDPARMPQLRIEYLKRSEAFAGRIVGSGLKPNFAYQIKLRGLYASDPEGFERIGKVGRWRLPGRETNYRDKDYEKYPVKPLVESYLFFDFLVSDGEGRVDKPFYADSTLHVLWSVNYQRAPGLSDTRPQGFRRVGTNLDYYANPNPDLSRQQIFAESEQHSLASNNRPAVNEAFLPPGRYVAEVVLTEESFHGYGDSGFWATVMSAPVEFEIAIQARPTPYWGPLPAATPLDLAKATTENIRTRTASPTVLAGKATEDTPVIAFAETLDLTAPGRHILSVEIKAAGRHKWLVYLDTESDPLDLDAPTYAIESDGPSRWQKFELEITSCRDADRLRLVPVCAPVRFNIRNVGIAGLAQ